jgi:hypothetical protein
MHLPPLQHQHCTETHHSACNQDIPEMCRASEIFDISVDSNGEVENLCNFPLDYQSVSRASKDVPRSDTDCQIVRPDHTDELQEADRIEILACNNPGCSHRMDGVPDGVPEATAICFQRKAFCSSTTKERFDCERMQQILVPCVKSSGNLPLPCSSKTTNPTTSNDHDALRNAFHSLVAQRRSLARSWREKRESAATSSLKIGLAASFPGANRAVLAWTHRRERNAAAASSQANRAWAAMYDDSFLDHEDDCGGGASDESDDEHESTNVCAFVPCAAGVNPVIQQFPLRTDPDCHGDWPVDRFD